MPSSILDTAPQMSSQAMSESMDSIPPNESTRQITIDNLNSTVLLSALKAPLKSVVSLTSATDLLDTLLQHTGTGGSVRKCGPKSFIIRRVMIVYGEM